MNAIYLRFIKKGRDESERERERAREREREKEKEYGERKDGGRKGRKFFFDNVKE